MPRGLKTSFHKQKYSTIVYLLKRTITTLGGGDVIGIVGVVRVEVGGVQHEADGALLGGQVLGAVGVHRGGVGNDGIVSNQIRILVFKKSII